MTSKTLHEGDRVEVPWELNVRRGVVMKVDDVLDRVLVAVDVDGYPEPISFPADAVNPLGAGEDWEPGRLVPPDIDTHAVLKPLLDALPGHTMSVGLLLTRDTLDQPILDVDIELLDPDDQDLSDDDLLAMHDAARKALRDALIGNGDRVEADIDIGQERLQAVHVRIAPRAASGS
jgi:hypothetical protein